MRKFAGIAILLTLAALGFRLYIALKLPNDTPDDGRVYAQIGRNLMEHHGYSIQPDPPFAPSYIRVPGYPVFLAGIYRVFGAGNNRAVRVIQAVLSAATCWIVALIAYLWAPDGWEQKKKLKALLAALALAAACPFTSIYVATVLTEVGATFFEAGLVLAATLGIMSGSRWKQALWWAAAGLCGGIATMFRPDGATFAAAAGLALVLIQLAKAVAAWRRRRVDATAMGAWKTPVASTFVLGGALSLGFAVALTPWTIRNARVFKTFQPIAPMYAEMPTEFNPDGYYRWLKTWVDDVKYTDDLEWNLDYMPIHINQFPEFAFDSADERARVGALLDKYNNEQPGAESQRAATTQAPANDNGDDDDDDSTNGDVPETATPLAATTNPAHEGQEYNVQITPEIDAGFAQIASEKISRHPIRYYCIVPFKRMISLWFDTHSQYYPFDGELFPLRKLDKDLHQQYWLPAFLLITWIYTGLVFAGSWILGRGKSTRPWLLFLFLLVIPRMMFLSSMENPEPRYVVELFVFVMAVGALPLVEITRVRPREVLAGLSRVRGKVRAKLAKKDLP
ncbi:MAG TPA: hypothetical protein VJX67_20745 [Blastocatellia bacterium]|nr:hypothetical protein [Blastocatellia bacterium]